MRINYVMLAVYLFVGILAAEAYTRLCGGGVVLYVACVFFGPQVLHWLWFCAETNTMIKLDLPVLAVPVVCNLLAGASVYLHWYSLGEVFFFLRGCGLLAVLAVYHRAFMVYWNLLFAQFRSPELLQRVEWI